MKKQRLFFLVNSKAEFSIHALTEKYLRDVHIDVGTSLPQQNHDYTFIILWNYKKIIPNISQYPKVILFHSSDLPHGKGWAPIYYSIAKELPCFTITGLKANDQVDAGEIFVKASFPLKTEHTATIIREWDKEITIYLLSETLKRFPDGMVRTKAQSGTETFYPRRYPIDNKIDAQKSIIEQFSHLKACENQHPAYFEINGIKFTIEIKPEITPVFNLDLVKVDFQ